MRRAGLTWAEFISRSRTPRICYPRHEFYWLARQAGYSSPRIGRYIGRDHSMVICGARAHAQRMESPA